jgi:hypothetical protein
MTIQNLNALNAFRTIDGKSPIAKWKSARHAEQLKVYEEQAAAAQAAAEEQARIDAENASKVEGDQSGGEGEGGEGGEGEGGDEVQDTPAPVVTSKRVATMNHKPSAEPKPLRANSNQAVLAVALVGGCTMEAATEVLNAARKARDPGSSPIDKSVVSATISYDLVKVKGYGVRSEMKEGTAHYFLVMPEGQTAPVITASKS